MEYIQTFCWHAARGSGQPACLEEVNYSGKYSGPNKIQCLYEIGSFFSGVHAWDKLNSITSSSASKVFIANRIRCQGVKLLSYRIKLPSCHSRRVAWEQPALYMVHGYHSMVVHLLQGCNMFGTASFVTTGPHVDRAMAGMGGNSHQRREPGKCCEMVSCCIDRYCITDFIPTDQIAYTV